MIKAILKGILSAVNQLINLITLPIDTLINAAFPDFSSTIQKGVTGISTLFSYVSNALGFLPTSLIEIIILIFGVHITFIVLNKTVNGITKLYHIIQKIKFW